MSAFECKVGFGVMIEAAAGPSRFRMTTLALLAVAAVVGVIIAMAVNAIFVRQFFFYGIRMACLAGDIFMQAL